MNNLVAGSINQKMGNTFPLMVSRKLCVDLCSGLGGFSQAFVDKGWEVIRIDNNPKFSRIPYTVIMDICQTETITTFLENKLITVLTASPPCTHFSIANPRGPRVGVQKSMEIVGACFELVALLKPRYWIIENPRGRLRKLTPTKPQMTIRYSDFSDFPTQKPTDLWSNFSLPMAKRVRRPYSGRRQTVGYNRFDRVVGRDPSIRSKIPAGVSEAVLEGVLNGTG